MSQPASRLLQLPDTCLQEVLQFCADDPRSLFSAARAHSRLHHVAALAASSITAVVEMQTRLKDVRQYLSSQGKHVSSLNLSSSRRESVNIQHLPHKKLRGLSSLSFSKLGLLLNPQKGVPNVFGSGACLKRLQLHHCELLEKGRGLAAALVAALSARPELQHLSIVMRLSSMEFPSRVLEVLQQLTYLELGGMQLKTRDAMRHLYALPRLQELRLERVQTAEAVQASGVSGLQHLSVLKLDRTWDRRLWLGVLAGIPRLQHLDVSEHRVAGLAEFLSHVGNLQQLTYLNLSNMLQCWPPPAYAALTASSKLQHLDIKCALPADVWQHIFPAGWQLPHLQTLLISARSWPNHVATALDGNLLVSCCPGLRSLSMEHVVCSAELLAPLTGLSSLHELTLVPARADGGATEGLEAACLLKGLTGVVRQLTRLKQLNVRKGGPDDSLLLQLKQLPQLTRVSFAYGHCGGRTFTAVSF